MYSIRISSPEKLVQTEIDGLKALGVEIVCNTVIGLTLSIEDLFESGYEAIFIGSEQAPLHEYSRREL